MMKLKKFKNRWLVTLCVSILVLGMVGVVNAATVQSGQNYQQAIANWIANDPNPMPMNMNTNMNTDPANGTTGINSNAQPTANNSTQPSTGSSQPAADNTQPAANSSQPAANNTQPATNNTQPAANNTQPAANNTQPAANNTQPAANTSGQNSQQPVSQNDLYNQMLQACLQMGGQMMQNCPMLNGSNMTPEQMIKICLQMNGQMMNMSQQNFAAMQQACQQWYQQGQKNPQNTQAPAQNNWGSMNMSGKWSNMGHDRW